MCCSSSRGDVMSFLHGLVSRNTLCDLDPINCRAVAEAKIEDPKLQQATGGEDDQGGCQTIEEGAYRVHLLPVFLSVFQIPDIIYFFLTFSFQNRDVSYALLSRVSQLKFQCMRRCLVEDTSVLIYAGTRTGKEGGAWEE